MRMINDTAKDTHSQITDVAEAIRIARVVHEHNDISAISFLAIP